MGRDAGKVLYETHEEILRAATKSRDAEIRDLKKIIQEQRVKVKELENRLADRPQGPREIAKKILE